MSPAPRTWFDALEARMLLSSAVIDGDVRSFVFNDGDGDQVTVTLKGPGSATITLVGGVIDRADIDSIVLAGTTGSSNLDIRVKKGRGSAAGDTTITSITGPQLGRLDGRDTSLRTVGLNLAGGVGDIRLVELQNGADLIAGDSSGRMKLELEGVFGVPDNDCRIVLPGGAKQVRVKGDVDAAQFDLGDDLGKMQIDGQVGDLAVAVDRDLDQLKLKKNAVGLTLDVGQRLKKFDTKSDVTGLRASVGDRIDQLQAKDLNNARLQCDSVKKLKLKGVLRASTLAATTQIDKMDVSGRIEDSLVLAGTALDGDLSLTSATFAVGVIRKLTVGGDVTDSVLAAGGDPGDDRLFEDNEYLPGGSIDKLTIRGDLVGTLASDHPNPGIYADELGKVKLKSRAGTAVIG
jgi:hypothetical protein